MKKKSSFVTEIITESVPEVKHALASGYGIGASATQLSGRVKEITIAKDGSPILCIQVGDNGNLSIINCTSMFEHLFGTHIHLKNTRPWNA